MLEFLEIYVLLRNLEARVRRRERVLVALGSAVVALNVAAFAGRSLDVFAVLHLAIACGFALNLRRIILDGIERRRDWLVMDGCATFARRRLSLDHYARRET